MLVGGAGFIGHHLALALKARGAEVSIVDGLQVNNLLEEDVLRRQRPGREPIQGVLEERLTALREADVPLIVQDARELEPFTRVIRDLRPQAIVHLAGIANAAESNRDPQRAFEHHARTLQHALTASAGLVEQFVFFSSSMVYGHFETGTVDEDTVCRPLGIYGSLKLAGEHLLRAHGQVADMPWTVIRPSALYGERCISGRVLQVFIERLERGLDLDVMGDGEDRLDFTYVGDLVDGTIRCLEHESARDQVFNLTCGHARRINEAIELLRTWYGDFTVNYHPKPRLMPDRGTLSIEKAHDLIGFAPEFSLERGLARYRDWYRARAAGEGPPIAPDLGDWIRTIAGRVPAVQTTGVAPVAPPIREAG